MKKQKEVVVPVDVRLDGKEIFSGRGTLPKPLADKILSLAKALEEYLGVELTGIGFRAKAKDSLSVVPQRKEDAKNLPHV